MVATECRIRAGQNPHEKSRTKTNIQHHGWLYFLVAMGMLECICWKYMPLVRQERMLELGDTSLLITTATISHIPFAEEGRVAVPRGYRYEGTTRQRSNETDIISGDDKEMDHNNERNEHIRTG